MGEFSTWDFSLGKFTMEEFGKRNLAAGEILEGAIFRRRVLQVPYLQKYIGAIILMFFSYKVQLHLKRLKPHAIQQVNYSGIFGIFQKSVRHGNLLTWQSKKQTESLPTPDWQTTHGHIYQSPSKC